MFSVCEDQNGGRFIKLFNKESNKLFSLYSIGTLIPCDDFYNELKSFNTFQEAVESKVFKGLDNQY